MKVLLLLLLQGYQSACWKVIEAETRLLVLEIEGKKELRASAISKCPTEKSDVGTW